MPWMFRAIRVVFKFPYLMALYFVFYILLYLAKGLYGFDLLKMTDMTRFFNWFFLLGILIIEWAIQLFVIWMAARSLSLPRTSFFKYVFMATLGVFAFAIPCFFIFLLMNPFLLQATSNSVWLILTIFPLFLVATVILGLFQLLPAIALCKSRFFYTIWHTLRFKSAALFVYGAAGLLLMMLSVGLSWFIGGLIPIVGPSILEWVIKGFFTTVLAISSVFFIAE